jgi:hypothetical protein
MTMFGGRPTPPRRRKALFTALLLGAVTALLLVPGAGAVSGAAFTTVDESVDGTGHCANGNPGVNCNIYDGKEFVWLNGGPAANGLGGDGDYFFAVLVPGGQPDPNDGGVKNLSDDLNGNYTTRTFTIASGEVSAYAGTHDLDSGTGPVGPNSPDGNPPFIRLFPYDDTTNPGGVYIMAICSLADGYPVDPRDCKYDAFKIKSGDEQNQPLSGPSVTKDANGAYDNTFAWSLQKCLNDISLTNPPAACQHTTTLNPSGTSVSVNYYIFVSYDSGTISNVKVTGAIQVFNGNLDDQNNTIPIDISDLADALSDSTGCTVLDAGNAAPIFPVTLSEFETDFSYSCDLGNNLPAGPLDNKVTVTWDGQEVGGRHLDAGSDDFTMAVAFTENKVDTCTTVTDSFNGADPADTLGEVCVGDANPTKFTKTRSITVQQATCVAYPNIATESTDGNTDTDTVTVCGRIGNGFTLGFWSNNNGRSVLCAHDPAWRNLLNGNGGGNYLRKGPTGTLYAVPTTGTCNNAHANFSSWLLAATATNMSYMLSAQLAATQLNVAYKNMNGSACVAGIDGNAISINNLIANAIAFLKLNGNTTAAGALRNTATAYKNIFDGLNNNLVNAVPGPC